MKRKTGRKTKSARTKRPRPARATAKTRPKNSIDAFVTASAQALGLTFDPAWHEHPVLDMRRHVDAVAARRQNIERDKAEDCRR